MLDELGLYLSHGRKMHPRLDESIVGSGALRSVQMDDRKHARCFAIYEGYNPTVTSQKEDIISKHARR